MKTAIVVTTAVCAFDNQENRRSRRRDPRESSLRWLSLFAQLEILRAGACWRPRRQQIADHSERHTRTLPGDGFRPGAYDCFYVSPDLLDLLFKRWSAILFH
jgi:hypothetical protein